MINSASRKSPPSLYLSANPPELSSSRPSSAFEDFTLFDVTDSRPASGFFASSASSLRSTMGTNPPTLTEILLDVAPPPWTLSAFTAYLSQNHCMETLEFTLDLQRYAAVHDQLQAENGLGGSGNQQLCALWEKLMQVYIAPCSPREINIPSRVRDRLLRLPGKPEPPHPRELEEAGRIVHELMNDSLLVPFLESASPMNLDSPVHDQAQSPKYPPYLDAGRGAGSSRSTSTHAFDSEDLTDDSDGNSPPPMEPMTPPTTPPTSAEWGASSPGGLQRAMAAHSKGWKRVGAKLGFSRKGSAKRPTPTSSSSVSDAARPSYNPL